MFLYTTQTLQYTYKDGENGWHLVVLVSDYGMIQTQIGVLDETTQYDMGEVFVMYCDEE